MKTITRLLKSTIGTGLRSLALLLAVGIYPTLTQAANVSMDASDSIGTSSLNSAGKWSNGQVPSAANDYFSGAYFIRTPGGSAGVTFAGHSLTLQNVIGGGQGAPQRSLLYKGGGGDTIIINNLTNADGSVLNNGGSGNVTAPIFTGNLWTIAGNSTIISDQGSTIIGYPLAGSFNLTNCGSVQSGSGKTVTFANSLSAWTGKLIIANINGGTIVALATNASNLGNPAVFTPDQITIGAACTLQDNVGLTFNNANGGFTLTGSGTINSGSTTVIGEPITGAFTLTAGAGVIVLSNANNTYSGGTTISAGTLRMGVVNALPATGSVTVTTILDLNTNSTTIDGLNGAGTVDTVAGGTPTLTVGANGGSGSFTGIIQNSAGTLSLAKVGAGTQTLAGYTYSGATLVTGGTLSLSSAGTLPSTPGDMTVSNSAALTVNASSGTALPMRNVTVGFSGTLNVTATGTAFGVNAAGTLTLGNNAAVNLNYGTVSANPTAAAINAAGISAPGTGIVINLSETGMHPGQFPVIKYAGPQLASVANFSLVMPLGVVAQLVNNTGEIDVNIISTPNNLVWNGLNGTNWDTTTANWTNAANGTITVYQQYTIGSTVVGDSVTFDDTLTNNFVNPQPTNINVTAAFNPYPVTVNSTRPYTLAGAGSLGGGSGFYLLKTNTGSLTLLTSNSFGGGVYIGGGSVIITNDIALGASSGLVTLNAGTLQVNGSTTNNTRAFSVPATATIGVNTNSTAQFGGAVTGAGGLTKTDAGTLVLTGSNNITGTLTVNQGTLTTLGTNVLAAVPIIGNAAGFNGFLNISGGIFQANNNGGSVSSSSLTIGNVAGAAGGVVMSSGSLTVNRQLTVGSIDYGAFSQSGGTTTIGGFIACGGQADGGVFNQSGGTVNMTNSSATIGYAAVGSYGVMNLSGNAVFNMVGAGNGVWPGEVGNGTLNVSGNAALTITNDGVALGRNTGTGTVNLNGGTITVNFITNGPIAGTFNFNGGTLKANTNGAAFTKGTANQTAFYVYNGGATIDDGGNAITFSQPLQEVSGVGIGSLTVTNRGSGYFSPPIVTITDGNGYGSNATATAQIDPVSGTVTNITVTCPGNGWDPVNSYVTLAFTGGGANATPPDFVNTGTTSFMTNGTGGFAKNGSGTLTMPALGSFPGPVNVNAGVLSITTASTLTGATTVGNGATLSIAQNGGSTSSLSNLTLSGSAGTPGATLGLAVTAANNQALPFVNCGTLTLNGTNTISLAGAVKVGSIALVKSVGPIAGSGNITNLTLPQGVEGSISTSFDRLYTTISVNITSTGPGLVWTGTNSVSALTNVWNINSAVNWLLGLTPTTYQQAIVPGDAVTFNDTGSGTVLLSNSVGPASLVISNNARTYTFKGTGTITGPTGITKLGTGTAIVNLANDNYVGNTTVSNGTLQLGTATAISSSANLFVGSGGTLELSGFSATVGELTGSGIIDNNSGQPPILTVGSSSGGTWNGTIQDHGAGGVALHKDGSGTWIVGGNNYLNDGQPFTDQSLITSGTVIITNGGLLQVSTLQLQIANGAGQSASVVVAGGTLAVTNNVLSVGYGSATANGTLTVNSGTVLHGGNANGGAFAAVPNSIDVGAQGATGVLTVNGGQVLNGQPLYLGDGTGASGTLYLNGGLLQAASVLPNGTPATSIAYFNGGTLQAVTNSASFLQVTCDVMGGGLILDDNGYTLSITTAGLQSGAINDGGFTKKGAGTVYLDTGSTYSGLTTVMNGTLAGIGSVFGSLLVAPAGNLGAGDAGAVGTFTVGNSGNLTLQGNATLRISKTGGNKTQDNLAVSGSISYGGVLTVNNVTSDSTALAVGDTFQLFSVTGATSGNFSYIAGIPGPGMAYSFNPATGVLSVVASAGPGTFTNPTRITGFALNGANVVMTGTNGQAGGGYYLLQSTNVALPLSQWKVVATNVLGANGNYTFIGTNVVAPGGQQQFYILSNTNSNH